MELLMERYELAKEKLASIEADAFAEKKYEAYFQKMASFAKMVCEYADFAKNEMKQADLATLQAWNERLYEDLYEENYKNSFFNPSFAVAELGEEFGKLLCALAAELRSMIYLAAEGRMEELLIRLELLVEVYSAFVYEMEENQKLPVYEEVRQILYWYVSDYSDITEENWVKNLVVYEDNFAAKILAEADLSGIEYLYHYGEYVSDNEIKTAQFMAKLPQETIDLMANTYTEGYRMGFVLGNKDLSKKKTVELRYTLGFERMMRKAMENFAALGLSPIIRRTPMGILQGSGLYKLGGIGGNPNKQYDYDHKDDKAIVWDKAMMLRKLEVSKTAFEQHKEMAYLFAGPAVQESFGEKDFEPVNKKEAINYTAEQQKLVVEYRSSFGAVQRNYILEEERSFTIIAFPVPEIGDNFEEIFADTIKINTLDYMKYRDIQQNIIDALDKADYVEIKGMGVNETDLKVNLWKLQNPDKETIFENCVADVNIPVGEVFTSPVLEGTNGVLHVSKVFLNGLEYRNLKITFENGMIKDFGCTNFEKEDENLKLVKENILYHRETLPLGEFAIGTNTTAYVIAKKWGIESKLPILIAEKMGPHFAVGDTCYSHAEDIKVYNPDGKEIVARENEVAALRNEKPAEAYFDCHTDITIPYDELGELTAVTKDGTRIPIVLEGRFVLPGSEALNEAFEM